MHLLRARAALALEVDAQAEEALAAALEAQPQLCEALSLRYSLAPRRDAVEQTDQLVADFARCAGAQTRVAEHARQRGDLADRVQELRGAARQGPGQPEHRRDADEPLRGPAPL